MKARVNHQENWIVKLGREYKSRTIHKTSLDPKYKPENFKDLDKSYFDKFNRRPIR